jgi:hypothetical protein
MEMNRLHPGFRCRLHRNRLSCVGTLRPSDIAAEYVVEISYDLNRRPRVHVIRPALMAKSDAKIPHMFRDGSLCLHMPDEWEPWMSIADTIVPWAALWLYYYELWHATDKWLGGGHEPNGRKQASAPFQDPLD